MDAESARRTLDDEERRGLAEISGAGDLAALEAVETSLFGRKSAFQEVQRSLGSMGEDERREIGRRTNEVRDGLRAAIATRREALEADRERGLLDADRIDVTLPGRRPRPGSLHPLTVVEYEIVDIFTSMGYRVVEGPEVETEYYNFDALNIPPEHPARRVSDSIYLDVPRHADLLLRTETSAMQIRTMEKQRPPVYVIAPGRVYRNEDVTAKNMPVFHQVEGLAVDEGITFADLKGTLEAFYRELLGDRRVRFTPSFFPFVEPGLSAGALCFNCDGAGCPTCGFEGWFEMMGAGMVHPNVLRGVGYDPERYTGFAFGGGYDRLAMARFNIPDIRMLWEGDVRFLERFEAAR